MTTRESAARMYWLSITFLIVLLTAEPLSASTKYALLVGVSSYPTLPPNKSLEGPKNDVVLMSQLLQKYGFAREQITLLADSVPEAQPPKRAAILGALGDLAKRVHDGDFVFLFFAGHGSQVPVQGPDSDEVDGRDEIFLPVDVEKWEEGSKEVKNAITDNEVGRAIRDLRNRGAFVWAVIDSCYSGTFTRALSIAGERDREVDPRDLKIPDNAFLKAKALTAAHGAAEKSSSFFTTAATQAGENAKGGLVAFYAAQSTETTVERPLPTDHPEGTYGLFTFHLRRALERYPTATYRQLWQQVLQDYASEKRDWPTPLAEGTHLDAPIFGTTERAALPRWPVASDGDKVTVQAGQLQLLTPGTVLAVVSNPAAPETDIMGYLQIEKAELLKSTASPLAYKAKPRIKTSDIPTSAYARLAEPNVRLTLKIARPPSSIKNTPKLHLQKVQRVLTRLKQDRDQKLFEWVDSSQEAEVRLLVEDDQIWFLEPSGKLIKEGEHKTPSVRLRGCLETPIFEFTL